MKNKSLELIFENFLKNYPATKQTILIANKTIIFQHVLSNIGLKDLKFYSPLQLDKINTELQTIVYCVGNRLVDSFPGGTQLELPLTAQINARNWIKHLLLGTFMGEEDADLLESKLISKRVVDAFFKKKDLELLLAFRNELKFALLHFAQPAFTANKELDADSEKQLICFIHNVLGLYPLFEPDHQETIVIPYKIQSKWVPVTYQFERLDISPQTGLIAKLIVDENERIYAYGLNPQSHINVSPYLLFSSTAIKTGQGAILSNLSNITPHYSPGESHDMTQVKRWLLKQSAQVVTAGLSQGGVLAMLTAARYPHLINTAYCLNPTGLAKATLKRLLPDWLALPEESRPSVIVYSQLNDPIFNFETAYLPGKNTHIYRVIPDKKRSAINSKLNIAIINKKLFKKLATYIQAHAHIYSGHHQVLMLKINSYRENRRLMRKFLGGGKTFFSRHTYPYLNALFLLHLFLKKHKVTFIPKVVISIVLIASLSTLFLALIHLSEWVLPVK